MKASHAKAGTPPALKAWVAGLTFDGADIPVRGVAQRMIHPGLEPIAGNGFVAAQPVRRVDIPGSWPCSVAMLHWPQRAREGQQADLEIEGHDSAVGALFTLVSDRRCEVVPEVFAHVEGTPSGQAIAIPLAGQADPALGSPMPEWGDLNRELRITLARISSLRDDDAWTISAAMHMHYCAALLAGNDLTGAYALAVGGIEALSQRYGSPPSEWRDWDESAGWDAFMVGQGLTVDQCAALRDRLTAGKHMRLSETFATYVMERLPAAFWEEPVSTYTWGVNGITGEPGEGTWGPGQPRAAAFAADLRQLKKALKRSYQSRSRFIHVGERSVPFQGDLLTRIPGLDDGRLSFAALRAALRRLILTEVERCATADRLPPIEWRLDTGGGAGGAS